MLQDQIVGAARLPPHRKRGQIMRGAVCLALAGGVLWLGRLYLNSAANFAQQKRTDFKTVADRMAEQGIAAMDQRLAPDFARGGVDSSLARVALLGFKQKRRLELPGAGPTGARRDVRSYPILGASGELGQKLREGNSQVLEGRYGVTFLHPNSGFHLPLRLDYPNGFDRARAKAEGRTRLGEDIMIHGHRLSAGCLAMGDTVAEDLFVLAAQTGLERITVLLSPVDCHQTDRKSLPVCVPGWTAELYAQRWQELCPFSGPAQRGG